MSHINLLVKRFEMMPNDFSWMCTLLACSVSKGIICCLSRVIMVCSNWLGHVISHDLTSRLKFNFFERVWLTTKSSSSSWYYNFH